MDDLLLETGDHLLQETGDLILLDELTPPDVMFRAGLQGNFVNPNGNFVN